MVYNWHERMQEESRDAEAAVRRIARGSADRTTEHVRLLRAALESLAARPLVRAMDPGRCDPRLADLPSLYPQASAFSVVNREGLIICHSNGLPAGPVRIADPSLHEEIRAAPRFRISRPVIGRVSGRWLVSAVQPVLDERGAFLGTVAVATELQRWRPFAPAPALPDGALITIINAQGEIVARSQDVEQWLGKKIWDAGLLPRIIAMRSAVLRAPGADGVARVYGVEAIPDLDWYVLAGVPESTISAAARRRFAETALLFAAAALVIMGLSLYFGGRITRGRAGAERALARHNERLAILHEIDRGMAAEEPAEAIAAAVIKPLRELLGVPRAIVNRFDLERGEVEWVAAAGRRQVHTGPGVRYPIVMMGDVAALRRGEAQSIDTRALPSGPHVDALLASGVETYQVVPMIASGELLGAISFGGARGETAAEALAIAREVAAQLAIATRQTRLVALARRHAAELEQRVAERTAALDAAKRDLEDLYDRAPCGYHSVDANGLIVRMNHTWLSWLGYERDEVVGKMRHPDLMTLESARVFWEVTFPKFLRDGFLDGAEFEYRRKDGSVFIGALNATSIYDAQGRYLMSRSTVYDVTARKKTEARLAALNKELESFSYSVSHDLRAPLRAIDGYSRMLEEDSRDQLGDEGRRLLGVVRASAQRMGRLIDDLLEFSRLGQLEPARARLDMRALAGEVAAELAAEYPHAELVLGELPPALADRALLRQVWLNLIGNAFKYSGPRDAPRIEISGRVEGGEAVYSVRDNGVGFDSRYAAKLYGVFQRLHRQDEFPGTGVGLAIVQRVVTRHGGRVWAESKLGEWARFSFSLPEGGSKTL